MWYCIPVHALLRRMAEGRVGDLATNRGFVVLICQVWFIVLNRLLGRCDGATRTLQVGFRQTCQGLHDSWLGVSGNRSLALEQPSTMGA